MDSLSRVILFLTSYFIVLALSFSINIEFEYLQSGLFLFISIIIAKSDFIEDKEEQEISDLISFWIEENLTKEEWEKAMSDMEI